MYHLIRFTRGITTGVERSAKQPLELLKIRAGVEMRAQVKPYVVESYGEAVEVADLFFEDGSSTRKIPFAVFVFVD
jgi:hypothetical protein